jgi:hypothetical protein
MGLSRAHVAAVASAAAIILAAAGGTASAASAGSAASGRVPSAAIGHGHQASGHGKFSARYISTPVRGYNAGRAQRAATAGATVPLWSSSIVSGGKTYKYQMVGKNPFVKQSTPSVSIGAPIIPVAFNFASGNAGGNFNPATAACGEALSDTAMVKQSPIFTKLSYTDGSTAVGTGEYTDIFQRANFWKYVGGSKKLNPNYHVNLTATVEPTVTINVATSAGQVTGSGCGATGLVDQIDLDSYLRTTLIPGLASISPTKIPVFIFRNVAMYLGHSTSNCCALGYHSGYTNSSGTPQFYTVTDIDDSGNFTGVQDVSDLAHEVGEWMDDPSGTNPTPAWGHVGQVPNGCQSNLEVGDPLTNTNLSITAANGRTYHPQELTFFSWFYRQAPSIGVNGFYSLAGTFTSPSKVCT